MNGVLLLEKKFLINKQYDSKYNTLELLVLE